MSPTYDQITFKASHNSYERDESLADQLTFNPEQPYNGGCLSLELDIWRHSSNYDPYTNINKDYFTVAHIIPGNKILSSYFDQILDWHANNPDHLPVLISIDIKSSRGGYDNFHDEIDTYLKCYFGEDLIFKPAELMKDTNLSLCENVIDTGWPEIYSEELIGKFIFCLSGNKEWKSEYSKTSLIDRYCFSDESRSDSDENLLPPENGNIVFFNFHIFNSNREVWMNTIPAFARNKLITRSYVSNSERNWTNCIKAEVSAIATDKINDHEWCMASNREPYLKKHESHMIS